MNYIPKSVKRGVVDKKPVKTVAKVKEVALEPDEILHCTWPVRKDPNPPNLAEVRVRLQRIKQYNDWCDADPERAKHYQHMHLIEETLLKWGHSPKLAIGIGRPARKKS